MLENWCIADKVEHFIPFIPLKNGKEMTSFTEHHDYKLCKACATNDWFFKGI